jgi:hypothetical protein
MHSPAGSAMLREVIFVESLRGSGLPGNEVTIVYQYWSKDGVLLAEHDTKWEDPAWPACDCRTRESKAAAGGLAVPAARAHVVISLQADGSARMESYLLGGAVGACDARDAPGLLQGTALLLQELRASMAPPSAVGAGGAQADAGSASVPRTRQDIEAQIARLQVQLREMDLARARGRVAQ